MRYFLTAIGLAGALFLVLSGCGSSSGTKVPGGPVNVVIHAANYGARRLNALTTPPSATNTNNGYNGVGVPGLGMMSGPPLGMKVYLQQVALTGSGSPTVIYTSSTAHTTDSGIPVTGCKLQLTSGTVDLSPCPGLSTLTIPAGTYTGMSVTFAEVAEIQGCLNGRFSFTVSAASGSYSYPAPISQTVAYTTDTVSSGTNYTYCTRKDQFFFQAETASQTAIGTNASYQPSAPYFSSLSVPEYVSIDIGNPNGQTMAQLKAASTTLTSSTVPTGSTFTLAVDMNRMLEFFGNVRPDFNPPGPVMHTGTSYFFSTKFTPVGGAGAVSAVTVYGGTLGSIQGYQWTATKTGDSSPSAAGWYTLYLDSSGNYLGGTMYEDDDNELTILKGNATLPSGTTKITASTTITMDIAGSLTNFALQTTTGGAPGTANLTAGGNTYSVSYVRLL